MRGNIYICWLSNEFVDCQKILRKKRTILGHKNFVMCLAINIKLDDTFATASLDGNIKIWQLERSSALVTLVGHRGGATCVDYFHGSCPYLASGGEDCTVKIWNYESKECVKVLDRHTTSIITLSFTSLLPVLVSASADSLVLFWNVISARYIFLKIFVKSC